MGAKARRGRTQTKQLKILRQPYERFEKLQSTDHPTNRKERRAIAAQTRKDKGTIQSNDKP